MAKRVWRRGRPRGRYGRPRHSLPIQALHAMQPPMLMKFFLAAGLAGLVLVPAADARRQRDQDRAFAQRQAGQILPLHDIEGRIVPQMRGCDYLGPEFDANSGVYRLKFMRGGTVIFVDVDGRNGRIIGRSGE